MTELIRLKNIFSILFVRSSKLLKYIRIQTAGIHTAIKILACKLHITINSKHFMSQDCVFSLSFHLSPKEQQQPPSFKKSETMNV